MVFKHLDNVDPATCLSGKMNRINRMTSKIFRKHLSGFDLTTSQLTLLFVLLKSGGSIQKDLADRLYMEKSTLNRNLKRLYQKGYVSKEDFPYIKLAYDGKVLLDKVVPYWEAAMKDIRNLLQPEGEKAVDKILTKLKNE